MKYTLTLWAAFNVLVVSHAQSQYEEPVNIPPYDAANPAMFLIAADSDWNHINDTAIQYFYVLPGDYSHAGAASNDYKIVLTASGTANQRRYISLHNGNNTHPGKLDTSRLAKVGFILQNADYWVIDRMAYWERYDGMIPITLENSSHNIINRYFASNTAGGMVYIYPYSDSNTIQNCRIQRDNISIHLDRAAIALSNHGLDSISIKNTKILNNEVYNFVDAFQAVKTGNANQNYINYEGTIIDYNHFYIDSLVYTDCNGNQSNHGDCAYAENAIDLKSGSENPNNPFVITNNMMWGYRKADTTSSTLNDPGAVIVAHFNVNNVLIKDNLLYNATRGIAVGNPVNGAAMRNSEISDNIIYDIKGYSFVIYDADSLTFKNNLNKETGTDLAGVTFSYWWVFHNSHNIKVENNLSVNTYDKLGVRNSASTLMPLHNGYFNSSPGQMQDSTDTIYTTDPTLNYHDLTFTTNRYTLHPQIVTIPRVLHTIPTGVDTRPSENPTFHIYPNPAFDYINIDQRKKNTLRVFIYNSSGQLIKTFSLHALSNKIDLSELKEGVYYLKIVTAQKAKIEIILKHDKVNRL